MKKREIIEKYIDFIIAEQRSGSTLEDIASYFKKELSIDISPKYISNILKNYKKKRKRVVVQDNSKIDLAHKNRKSKNIINIYRNNKKIGTLARTEGMFIFAYEDGVSEEERFIKPGIHYSFPAELENLLPEGINRELLAKKHNINPEDSFELLQYIDDAYGGYSTQPIMKKVYKKFDFNPKRYEDTIIFSKDITIDPDVLVAIRDLYLKGSSDIVNKLSNLSGQQPKFVATFFENRLYLPNQMEYSNAIVKVSNKQYANLNIVENMLLSLARFELHIKTAKTFVLIEKESVNAPSFAKETYDHFIAERFDRDAQGPKQTYELLALLGKTSDQKYSVSLEEIFTKAKEITDEESTKELAKYFYFSYIAGNGDAHAKNISFYKKDGKFKIAPLYDVVNTSIYGIEGNLGVTLNKKENIQHSELCEFLSEYIDEKELLRIRNIFFKKIYNYIEKTIVLTEHMQATLKKFYEEMEKRINAL